MSSGAGGAPQDRELVICHGCDNEWWREEHGLECPRCHGDFVEIVDPRDDPRSGQAPPPRPTRPDSLPQHPLHDHDPWRDTAHNPDEENIDHVSFSPAPGVHFQRTFIRSGGPRTGQRGRSPNDETVGSLFQAIGGFLQGANQNRQDGPHQPRGVMFANGPQFATQNPFPPPNHHPQHRVRTGWSTGMVGGGRNTWTAEDRIFPQNIPRNNGNDPLVGVHAMMTTMLAQMQDMGNRQPPNGRNPHGGNGIAGLGLPDILAQIFGPANGVHGDAVYSQEAFDRIIGQMMEQNGGSNAPGPAAEAAIAALPKRKVDKTMMGSDGKAECSVCMDNVEIGDEITMLPCNHWFHEQCVSIWLKEHDTCPHCRKGITPAEGEPTVPRSPGQIPRHNTNPFDMAPPDLPNVGPAAPFTQPGMQHPYVPGGYPSYPEPQSFVRPPPSPQPSTNPQSLSPGRHNSRRSSTSSREHPESSRNSSSGNGGGVSGWLRNLRGGSRNQDS